MYNEISPGFPSSNDNPDDSVCNYYLNAISLELQIINVTAINRDSSQILTVIFDSWPQMSSKSVYFSRPTILLSSVTEFVVNVMLLVNITLLVFGISVKAGNTVGNTAQMLSSRQWKKSKLFPCFI